MKRVCSKLKPEFTEEQRGFVVGKGLLMQYTLSDHLQNEL